MASAMCVSATIHAASTPPGMNAPPPRITGRSVYWAPAPESFPRLGTSSPGGASQASMSHSRLVARGESVEEVA